MPKPLKNSPIITQKPNLVVLVTCKVNLPTSKFRHPVQIRIPSFRTLRCSPPCSRCRHRVRRWLSLSPSVGCIPCMWSTSCATTEKFTYTLLTKLQRLKIDTTYVSTIWSCCYEIWLIPLLCAHRVHLPWLVIFKLRRFGLWNQIVKDSESKPSEFERPFR